MFCLFPAIWYISAVLHRFNSDCIFLKKQSVRNNRFYYGTSFLNSPYILLRTQARAWLPDDAVVSPVLSLDSSSSFILSILLLAPLSLNDPVTCSLSAIIEEPVLSGHSKRRPKIGFKDRLLLNAGQKYTRMLEREQSAILSTNCN